MNPDESRRETNKLISCLKKTDNCYNYCSNILTSLGDLKDLNSLNIIDHNKINFTKTHINNNSVIVIPKGSFIYRSTYIEKGILAEPYYYGSLFSAFKYFYGKMYMKKYVMFMYRIKENMNLLILNDYKIEEDEEDEEIIFLQNLLNVFVPSNIVNDKMFRDSFKYLYENKTYFYELVDKYVKRHYTMSYDDFLQTLNFYMININNFLTLNQKEFEIVKISTFITDKLIESLLAKYNTNFDGFIYIDKPHKDFYNTILYKAKLVESVGCIPFEFCVFNGMKSLDCIGYLNFKYGNIEFTYM